jgi:hypothetical protein
MLPLHSKGVSALNRTVFLLELRSARQEFESWVVLEQL